MRCVADLPDDPMLLKQLLVEREAQIEQIKQEAAAQIEALQQRHQAELAAILRRMYGPRSERFDATQLLLFGLRVDTMTLDEASLAREAGEALVTRRVRRQHKHGRGALPDHLPRTTIEHDLSENEKKCPCCGEQRQRIGQEVSEQLEFIPASLHVLEHVRYKYACRRCEEAAIDPQIELATKATQPIEKGLAGPGLLAYVITSKLGDHLPLYRLERIFARQGVAIARSTMCAWLAASAELVGPLVRLMAQRVRQSAVIHTDETRVPIQAPGTGRCQSGRIWVYLGDRHNPYVVYDYTPDRTRAGPRRWLADYRGYLQADAYGGYDGIYASGEVIEVACWAHARRKFFDARETDQRRAAELLSMVRDLYAIEDAGRELDEEARRERRQGESVPILKRIREWLEREQKLVLPRSPMAQAIGYVINQWNALCAYTRSGALSIDNNAAERALKRVAIGRKNWLFAGNDRGGATAATLYTLIASAEAHGLDPQRYLRSVLAKIASTPVSELDQFLPDVWKREDEAEPTPS